MTRLESLRHDLENQVKTITVSQTLPYRLEIALEHNSYDGPIDKITTNFTNHFKILTKKDE